jgi:hypothetical protein
MNVSFNNPSIQHQSQAEPQQLPHQMPGTPQNPARPGMNPLTQQMMGSVLANIPKGRAEAAGTMQLTGTMVFDDIAGVKQEDHTKKQAKTLRQRQQTTVQQRNRNAQRKSVRSAALTLDDHDAPIKDASSSTLAALRGKGREQTEEDLEREYNDPLQRYSLLHNTLSELEDRDMPAAEKEELKEHLNGMLSDLVAKHRDAIRKGLRDQTEVAASMQAMAGNNASLREIRFLYGAKGAGVFDSPLSPLAMAKALHERFGADNFTSGMGGLRTRMSTEFHAEPEKGMNPRFWLCMTDAAAFNAVQSTHAIAGELRRDLIEKAHVMPKASNAAVTVSLLGVVDAGKSKVNSLVSQIYDLNEADPVQKGRVYEQVLLAVRKLPHSFWPQEKLAQRMEVVEDLLKQVGVAYRGMPTLETGVERHERQWRESWDKKEECARRRKQNPDAVCGNPLCPACGTSGTKEEA